MAMAAPLCCSPLFVWERAVTDDVRGTSDTLLPLCPCTGLYSRRSSRQQPGTPLLARTQGRTGDCTFSCAGCRFNDRKIERDLAGV